MFQTSGFNREKNKPSRARVVRPSFVVLLLLILIPRLNFLVSYNGDSLLASFISKQVG